MPSLDDLSTTHPVAQDSPLDRLRESFVTDFGDITGSFVQNGSSSEFHATYAGTLVNIRIHESPRGVAEYTINGNKWYPPGDMPTRPLAERQALLIDAVRRYVR